MKILNLNEMETIQGGDWGSCGAGATAAGLTAVTTGLIAIPVFGQWATLGLMAAACYFNY